MRRPVADCSHPWHEVEGGEKKSHPPAPASGSYFLRVKMQNGLRYLARAHAKSAASGGSVCNDALPVRQLAVRGEYLSANCGGKRVALE